MAHQVPTPTHASIIAAIALCDQLGIDRFLAAHGYAMSKRYVLRHGGRSYPSKAIIGVASGLSAREFSGGAAHTCRVLRRLGFMVRGSGAPRSLDVALSTLALAAGAEYDYTPPPAPELPVEPVCYFASGCNQPGEIRAFADMGHDVGFCALEIGPGGIAELLQLAGTDVQVFGDSGAFGEVKFGAAGPVVVKPIDDRKWRTRILSLYKRLGEVLGSQLQVVAPDRVGCQETTLDRLRTYAPEMRELHAMGVRILLPVQRGSMTQADFYRAACEVLGFEPVPALPCKKAATSVEEAASFARDIQPRTVHLLGLGTRSVNVADYLTAIVGASPATMVQMDSVIITSLAGRTNGPGGRPRRLTAGKDLAVRLAATCAQLATAANRTYLALLLALGAVGVAS